MNNLKDIDVREQLKDFFNGGIGINESLSLHTSIKIGGKSYLFLTPQDNDDLIRVLEFLSSMKIEIRIIGKGTNLLIDSADLPFAVIRLSEQFFRRITISKDMLYARGGISLAGLLNFCIKNRIGGFEFLSGIPGTLAGALVMNAGVRNLRRDCVDEDVADYLNISDRLIRMDVMDSTGAIFTLNKADAGFVYRGSNLKDLIIWGAYFKIKSYSSEMIINNIRAFMKRRKMTQDIYAHSAGCVFKNPQGKNISAGALIDKAGLKGCRVGNAQVSEMHANFIVNKGSATFGNVRELMSKISEKVEQDFSVKLEPEIEIWEGQGANG